MGGCWTPFQWDTQSALLAFCNENCLWNKGLQKPIPSLHMSNTLTTQCVNQGRWVVGRKTYNMWQANQAFISVAYRSWFYVAINSVLSKQWFLSCSQITGAKGKYTAIDDTRQGRNRVSGLPKPLDKQGKYNYFYSACLCLNIWSSMKFQSHFEKIIKWEKLGCRKVWERQGGCIFSFITIKTMWQINRKVIMWGFRWLTF